MLALCIGSEIRATIWNKSNVVFKGFSLNCAKKKYSFILKVWSKTHFCTWGVSCLKFSILSYLEGKSFLSVVWMPWGRVLALKSVPRSEVMADRNHSPGTLWCQGAASWHQSLRNEELPGSRRVAQKSFLAPEGLRRRASWLQKGCPEGLLVHSRECFSSFFVK